MESEVTELQPNKACKYLGLEESHKIEHKNKKEMMKKEYVRRL